MKTLLTPRFRDRKGRTFEAPRPFLANATFGRPGCSDGFLRIPLRRALRIRPDGTAVYQECIKRVGKQFASSTIPLATSRSCSVVGHSWLANERLAVFSHIGCKAIRKFMMLQTGTLTNFSTYSQPVQRVCGFALLLSWLFRNPREPAMVHHHTIAEYYSE